MDQTSMLLLILRTETDEFRHIAVLRGFRHPGCAGIPAAPLPPAKQFTTKINGTPFIQRGHPHLATDVLHKPVLR